MQTLLDEVRLMHQSLPEIAWDDIDLHTTFFGKKMAAPLMISGMTGGTDKAREINQILARTAQTYGLAMGLGSQRTMMRDPSRTDSYAIRELAPDIPLLGNLGVVQLAQSSRDVIEKLIQDVGVDALCVHVNPAQEMIQDHGDRDFRGCVDALQTYGTSLSVPVIVKETGAGMSPQTLEKVQQAGIQWVDVSGAGGTTWVGVEALRNSRALASVGDILWDWGVPTAASIVYAQQQDLHIIASGGIRTGLDAARAIALGASIASCALPWLRAAMEGGQDATDQVAETMIRTLKTVMLLTGSATIADLQQAPKILGPELQSWL